MWPLGVLSTKCGDHRYKTTPCTTKRRTTPRKGKSVYFRDLCGGSRKTFCTAMMTCGTDSKSSRTSQTLDVRGHNFLVMDVQSWLRLGSSVTDTPTWRRCSPRPTCLLRCQPASFNVVWVVVDLEVPTFIKLSGKCQGAQRYVFLSECGLTSTGLPMRHCFTA